MNQAFGIAVVVERAARSASNWLDLQWSLVVDLLERVAPQARGRLLDVGCGDRPYEAIFRPFVTDYVGIEHEESFVATAASMGKKRGPDFLYDGHQLPFEDRSFDTVLSVQVLEHTPHPATLVREMARVLKDDGVLILSAPFQFRLHEEPHDYFRFSPHGLRVLCEQAGLAVVEVHAQGSIWSVLSHKLNSFLAFKVARAGGVAQKMGKLSHEGVSERRPRYWLFPLVAPTLFGFAAAGRILDRLLADPEEALGFLVVARRGSSAVKGNNQAEGALGPRTLP